MKKLIILTIFTLFTSTLAMAKCAAFGIYCTNKSTILNKNGILILEFYGRSQGLVPDLNKKYSIYLANSKERIKLNVIEILEGNGNLTQLVLKPVATLKANKKYTLLIDKLPKEHNFSPVTFDIKDMIDNEIPVISRTPTEGDKSYWQMGCGDVSWVLFNISAQDNSELFVRTMVKNIKTGVTTTYILNIENGLVHVGHSMCSGAFRFDNGNEYEVTFRLLDQSGNNGVLTKSVAFTKPTILTNKK